MLSPQDAALEIEQKCAGAGITLAALCKKAQVDRSTVTRWKQGRGFSSTTYGRLISALDGNRENTLRTALRSFMDGRGLTIAAWARAAGMKHDSALRNFMDGLTETLTYKTLAKLAAGAGVGVDAITGKAATAPAPLTARATAKGIHLNISQFVTHDQAARIFAILAEKSE